MLTRSTRNSISYGAALRRASLSSTSGHRAGSAFRASRLGLVSGGVVAASLLYGFAHNAVHADAEGKQERSGHAPLSALVRSYVVYSLCSIPALVDYSPALLSALLAVPGLRQLTEAVIRVTFFDQFVGGDTAEDCIPVLEQLRRENKGCLFAYSVEVDEAEAAGAGKGANARAPHKEAVEETIHCIDVAADFEDRYVRGATQGRRTWVALKLTALLPDAEALVHLSKHLLATRPPTSPPVPFPGVPAASDLDVLAARSPAPAPLTPEDLAALRELRDDLVRICERARARGVRVIIDAEHSWYEPAIDAYTLALMRTFNALPAPSRFSWFSGAATSTAVGVQPLVYATHQAYLRREPGYLADALRDARAANYALGVKLVRGAYHPHEITAHVSASAGTGSSPSISPDAEPPVWPTKPQTDACYDACARTLVQAAAADFLAHPSSSLQPPRIGVLFGSHNAQSCVRVLEEMERAGMAVRGKDGVLQIPQAAAERVAVAQLFGMRDELTDKLVERTRASAPFVIKYVPYGSLKEVIPYLSRRAIENKSVLGGGAATEERRRAGGEIWRRLFG